MAYGSTPSGKAKGGQGAYGSTGGPSTPSGMGDKGKKTVTGSKEVNRGPGKTMGGRIKGFTKTLAKKSK